jgi:hypothetical protein
MTQRPFMELEKCKQKDIYLHYVLSRSYVNHDLMLSKDFVPFHVLARFAIHQLIKTQKIAPWNHFYDHFTFGKGELRHHFSDLIEKEDFIVV